MKLLLFCTKCKENKTKDSFYEDKSKKSGYHTNCKQCQKTRLKNKRKNDIEWNNIQKQKSKQWRIDNPIANKVGIKNATYKKKYKITYTDFLKHLEDQNNLCLICKHELQIGGRYNTSKTAVVDHCHITESFRGIICHRCNIGLGCFEDNPKLLVKAQEYLSSNSYF